MWLGSKRLYDVSAPNMNLHARDDRRAATTVDQITRRTGEAWVGSGRSILVTRLALHTMTEHGKIRPTLTSQFQPVSTIWACGGAQPRDDGSWERIPLRGRRGERDGEAPGRAARGSLEGRPREFVA